MSRDERELQVLRDPAHLEHWCWSVSKGWYFTNLPNDSKSVKLVLLQSDTSRPLYQGREGLPSFLGLSKCRWVRTALLFQHGEKKQAFRAISITIKCLFQWTCHSTNTKPNQLSQHGKMTENSPFNKNKSLLAAVPIVEYNLFSIPKPAFFSGTQKDFEKRKRKWMVTRDR